MSESLCISVTFLDPRYHGRGDGGAPEWPPSPMRLFQAMVAGNGQMLDPGSDIYLALRWLETQPPPTVVAPPGKVGTPCPLYVPNNAMDLVAKSWGRGNIEASIAEHRTLKTVRPTHLRGGDTVHYLWPIASTDADPPPVKPLARAVEKTVALGWGIDLVVTQCRVLSSSDSIGPGAERWDVAEGQGTSTLRCPAPGSLNALMDRHGAFLDRLADDTFHPVPPLTTFRAVGYRRSNDPVGRPFECFELRHDDGRFCAYSQRKLIHIAGMVRHLGIELMKQAPPRNVDDDWVETFVAGHSNGAGEHRQFSYLPLPSIGHRHADQLIRRVMITAPQGEDAWLGHLTRRLEGQRLKPERGDEFGELGPPTLVSAPHDNIARHYATANHHWASVTPVILPGHDDRKPEKTRKLIETALRQARLEQPCTFEWSPFSRFPKSFSAHKYDSEKRPKGYIRPNYLSTQTAIHLTLQFSDGLKVPGPIAIGAGRHCGFGLLAPPPMDD